MSVIANTSNSMLYGFFSRHLFLSKTTQNKKLPRNESSAITPNTACIVIPEWLLKGGDSSVDNPVVLLRKVDKKCFISETVVIKLTNVKARTTFTDDLKTAPHCNKSQNYFDFKYYCSVSKKINSVIKIRLSNSMLSKWNSKYLSCDWLTRYFDRFSI